MDDRLNNGKQIKAVIFDWGGVLIDDPSPGLISYCSQALGVGTEELSAELVKYLPEFQKGLVSENEFWQKVCSNSGVPAPEGDSLWGSAFKRVYSPKPEIFDLATSLRSRGYKTALLTNTEVPAMEYFLKQSYAMFDQLVFSCAEFTRKPERQIYSLVLDRLGVEPSEGLFIDDRAEFIEGANRAGLKTILFRNPGDTKRLLSDEMSRA